MDREAGRFRRVEKYPVLMFQYSGPNSQQVLDKYSFDWEQYLAANGIITVCVDGRGTGARGEAFRKCTYLRMGELESKDQVEAAQALGKLPLSTRAAWLSGDGASAVTIR